LEVRRTARMRTARLQRSHYLNRTTRSLCYNAYQT
jgi:hypothetical protein